jgi:hypothetical protein
MGNSANNLVFNKRAVFTGCVKSCADALPRFLDNISRVSALFAESAFIFVENDSTDSTKVVIRDWCGDKPNARLISLDRLDASCPFLTIRLETARNVYLSEMCSHFSGFDYLFVLDCDERAVAIDLDAMSQAVGFLSTDENCAGVFGNCRSTYYDMWALRHPTYCPGDVWEEVCDYAVSHNATDEEAFQQTLAKRLFSISPDVPPFEVDSAFGGLGIYKISSVLRNKNKYLGRKMKNILSGTGRTNPFGWQCCEHVSFNAGFRDLGERLFVLPYLINCDKTGVLFPPSAWLTLLFDPQFLSKNFDLHKWGVVGRNQPCPCGSGKKYKRCHGAFDTSKDQSLPTR